MLVRELMSRDVVCVTSTDTVATARDRLREHQVLHLLVVDTDADNVPSVAGVVAFRDLAGKPESVTVAELMTRDVATIDAGASARRAASLMIRSTSGCLPVTEDGKLAGIITTTDLMRVLNADMTLS
jgi:CBS domain-containing protein